MKTILGLSLICFVSFAPLVLGDNYNGLKAHVLEYDDPATGKHIHGMVWEIFTIITLRDEKDFVIVDEERTALKRQSEYRSELFDATPGSSSDFFIDRITGKQPIPTEARGHFVTGTTLFKDAHSTSDYDQVVREFTKAVELAPWWLEAHYNLALVLEARGANLADVSGDSSDYMEAIVHLKLYIDISREFAKVAHARHVPFQNDVDSNGEYTKIMDKIYQLKAKATEGFKKAVPKDWLN